MTLRAMGRPGRAPASRSVILLGGVPISGGAKPGDPYPDYLALRAALAPLVIDPRTVAHYGGWPVRMVGRLFGSYWACAVTAWLVARRDQPIIATGEDVGLRLALLLKYTRRRRSLAITCHNIAGRRAAFYLGRLRVWTAVSTFHCLAQSQMQMLQRLYGVPQDRLSLLLWHVDHQFFQPRPDPPVQHRICSAGMASRDYRTLLEAVRNLDVEVKIAADSPWFRRRLDIDGLSLPPRVEVRSYGTYAALRDLYAASLFVVVPLYDVPFSAGYTVILEAMAMGKAVIASRITQVDDFIEDGVTGFHVPPGDVDALRERIAYLLEHPEVAEALGARARAAVEARFTLAHYVARIRPMESR